jgi:hypothetical protein
MRSWSVGEIYNNGESPHTPLPSGGGNGGGVVMKMGHNNHATPTQLLTMTVPSSTSSSKLHHQKANTLLLSASPRTIALGKKNVLEWLDDDAPSELLPKILSFCGSRKMHALSRVNKKWNAIMKDEYVWRTLCEDTHKWSDLDALPTSWAQHYKLNPIVPIDYDSVDAEFESISTGPECMSSDNRVAQRFREQHKSARILVHPDG